MVTCSGSVFGFFSAHASNITVPSAPNDSLFTNYAAGNFSDPITAARKIQKRWANPGTYKATLSAAAPWVSLGLEILPNVSGPNCTSSIPLQDGMSYNNSGTMVNCYTGNGTNVNSALSGEAVVVFKPGTNVTINNLNFGGGGRMIINENATVTLSRELHTNGGIWVYGNLNTIKLNLDKDLNPLYISANGVLNITGDFLCKANTLISGGIINISGRLENSENALRLCHFAEIYTHLFTKNDVKNANGFITTHQGGCLTMVDPGVIGGFSDVLSKASEFYICIPPTGVINNIGDKGGTAIVLENCSNCAVVLPVTLKSFSGQLKGNASILEWTVADSREVSFFSIEHSRDSRNFSIVGNVFPHTTTDYHFLHKEMVTGNNYYRLVVKGKDGNTYYSRIVVIPFGRPVTFIAGLQPTLIRDHAQLSLVSARGQSVLVQIANPQGDLVKKIRVPVQPGTNHFMVSFLGLPGSVYWIHVQTEDGRKQTIKVLKR